MQALVADKHQPFIYRSCTHLRNSGILCFLPGEIYTENIIQVQVSLILFVYVLLKKAEMLTVMILMKILQLQSTDCRNSKTLVPVHSLASLCV